MRSGWDCCRVYRRSWRFCAADGGKPFRASGARFWRALRWLLILAQFVLLVWQPLLWLYGEPLSGIGIALVVADIVALLWLVTNPRLRACFTQEPD